ncbi:MAG: hypothetical protein BWX63_02329 [Bacteroidetes bacterium ADurb.Bin041]|nr:MAG: hypothetical protein BWX63_02329 [Bacteroidetes bacterium ADurb.Bin041]
MEGCETAPADTNNGFQPGDKKSVKSLSLFPTKSSVGTTDTNNGFQPGDKKSVKSLSLFPRKSSVGTTDINNGFQPGDKKTFIPKVTFIKSMLYVRKKLFHNCFQQQRHHYFILPYEIIPFPSVFYGSFCYIYLCPVVHIKIKNGSSKILNLAINISGNR